MILKTFAILATIYGPYGPSVYVLDRNISGPDCLAAMERGITPEIDAAVKARPIMEDGPDVLQGPLPLSRMGAILSCEFDADQHLDE